MDVDCTGKGANNATGLAFFLENHRSVYGKTGKQGCAQNHDVSS